MSGKKHIEEIRRDLGKWAFVEKTGRAEIILSELFSNALLVAGGAVFIINGSDGLLWGSLIVLVALIISFVSYSKQRSHIECHEKGLMEVGGAGVKVLQFDDLGSFTYGVTNHFKNGSYQHTAIEISLLKAAGGGSSYSFKTHSQGSGKFGVIVDLVSPYISKRMRNIIREKGSVTWAGQVSLSSRGIHTSRRNGKKGEREEVLFPFWEDMRYVFEEGNFHIFDKVTDNVAVTIPCSAENFNPGFLLLKRLYAEAEEAGTLIKSKIVETKGEQDRKADDRTTCPSCGFRRKWSLFKKYGAVKQTSTGSMLTCFSCHEAVFPIEGRD